jgi:hypothetical protein
MRWAVLRSAGCWRGPCMATACAVDAWTDGVDLCRYCCQSCTQCNAASRWQPVCMHGTLCVCMPYGSYMVSRRAKALQEAGRAPPSQLFAASLQARATIVSILPCHVMKTRDNRPLWSPHFTSTAAAASACSGLPFHQLLCMAKLADGGPATPVLQVWHDDSC